MYHIDCECFLLVAIVSVYINIDYINQTLTVSYITKLFRFDISISYGCTV